MTKVCAALTLTQLARAVGMTVGEVKYYRDYGLLQPARRRPGRQDDGGYHREHVDRLLFIARAVSLSFTTEDIAQLVTSDALITCSEALHVARQRLAELRRIWGSGADSAHRIERLIDASTGTDSSGECTLLAVLNGKAEPPAP